MSDKDFRDQLAEVIAEQDAKEETKQEEASPTTHVATLEMAFSGYPIREYMATQFTSALLKHRPPARTDVSSYLRSCCESGLLSADMLIEMLKEKKND